MNGIGFDSVFLELFGDPVRAVFGAGEYQDTLDRFVFATASFDHFNHLHRLLFATRLLSKLLNCYRQVSHPDALPIPKHDAAFDRILKFPNVTGPRVGFEHCEHRIVKLNANTICRYPPGQR